MNIAPPRTCTIASWCAWFRDKGAYGALSGFVAALPPTAAAVIYNGLVVAPVTGDAEADISKAGDNIQQTAGAPALSAAYGSRKLLQA